MWTLQLFEQIEVGVYCAQVKMQKEIGFTAYHALLVSITKQYEHCVSEEEAITMLEDNRGVTGYMKKGYRHSHETSNWRRHASFALRAAFQARKHHFFLSTNNAELFLS